MPRFQPGVSGNPKGAPRGPHKMTREVNRLASAAGPSIVKDIINRAKRGDPFLQSLFVRHLLPRSRLNPEPDEVEKPKTAREAAERLAEIYATIASGALDFDTAATMISALQAFITGFKVAELEQRAIEMREEIARLRAEAEEMGRR
jgi:hypothetical protein